ncbi:MAG: DUF2254 domain-containing protein [Xanthomonadaceae bacterium]|nr:DUF2254 domain-containing protein [Xanthomonadaceae bacterium]
MNSWLEGIVDKLRASFWPVPSLMFSVAVVLALWLPWVDRNFGDALVDNFGWLYGGEAEGARAMLSTIAGSMMTVTGVVFSITILTLVLASAQFGSRLLQSFMRDPGNQVVLGSFVSTFVYSIIVLRSVRDGFVPQLSVTVALLLVFASVAVLIYFIHHVATKIQAESVVATVHRELSDTICRLLSEHPCDDPQLALPDGFEQDARPVLAPSSGYLQVTAHETLVALSAKHDLVVRAPYRAGDFVIEGTPLLYVRADRPLDDKLNDELADTLAVGSRRTITQDIEHGVHQLVQIGVRALSTGINDPFTAINCIDRLAAALCQIARRHFPSTQLKDEDGRLRVVIKGNDFAGCVDAAFNQIRQHAGTNPAVVIRLLEAIGRVSEAARTDSQRRPLMLHADMVLAEGRRAFTQPRDLEALERRYQAVQAA